VELALAGFLLAPGLALGSFLNVVAARVPLRRSIVRPRSACMACDTTIAWYDNLPVVSYVVLRGRCRSCGAKIGLVYPAVELATALLLAGCVLRFGFSGRAGVAAVFCATLVAIAAIDVEHRIVPNRIVLPAAGIVALGNTVTAPSVHWIVGGLGASAFLLAAALAYPRGLGMGDVKLALLLGAGVGWSVTVALMVAMISALVPAVFLLARHGQAARKMALPFAPFLALGGVVALFAGPQVLDQYLKLF
jgi:leader peptidase (prepilin peptidase)/N-methyltransferase